MLMQAFVHDIVVTQMAFVLGTMAVVKGLWVLLNQDRGLKLLAELRKNPDGIMVLYAGLMNLLFGLIVLSLYSRWVQSWEVLITLLGWLMVVKGLVLAFNARSLVTLKFTPNFMTVSGIVSLVIGGILLNGAFRFV